MTRAFVIFDASGNALHVLCAPDLPPGEGVVYVDRDTGEEKGAERSEIELPDAPEDLSADELRPHLKRRGNGTVEVDGEAPARVQSSVVKLADRQPGTPPFER